MNGEIKVGDQVAWTFAGIAKAGEVVQVLAPYELPDKRYHRALGHGYEVHNYRNHRSYIVKARRHGRTVYYWPLVSKIEPAF